MTKTPYTLKEDIEHVLRTGEGYTREISEWVGHVSAKSIERQLSTRSKEYKPTLRFSNLGTKCDRKLWYSVNSTNRPEPLLPSTLNKFIFGDLTEAHMLGLVKATGHTLSGLQDRVDILGVNGSRDCIIDGMVFDIKSASTFSFEKFKQGGLRDNDPFGYLSQLSSYVYASRGDPLVTYKNFGGFLAVDKQHGHIAVDIYDFTEELQKKEEEVQYKIDMVGSKSVPPRGFEPVPQYINKKTNEPTNGNLKLDTYCSYCDRKFECWPKLRTFISSQGPVYFTKVEKEPKMEEIVK